MPGLVGGINEGRSHPRQQGTHRREKMSGRLRRVQSLGPSPLLVICKGYRGMTGLDSEPRVDPGGS